MSVSRYNDAHEYLHHFDSSHTKPDIYKSDGRDIDQERGTAASTHKYRSSTGNGSNVSSADPGTQIAQPQRPRNLDGLYQRHTKLREPETQTRFGLRE